MTSYPILTEPQLSQEAIRVLIRELGPVNALRFIAHRYPNQDGKDSVQRHRDFAASVENDDEFFERLWRLIEQENEQLASGQQTDSDVEAS